MLASVEFFVLNLTVFADINKDTVIAKPDSQGEQSGNRNFKKEKEDYGDLVFWISRCW